MLYRILQILFYPFVKVLFRVTVENSPEINDKKLILCANHISVMDPILLAVFYRRKIRFIAKKELFKHKIFIKLFNNLGAFPVDRQGNDLKAIKKSLEILKNDEVLGIFPEGTRVTNVSEENIKVGIGLLAYKSESDILPVFIEGNYKLFRKMKIKFREKIKIEDYKNISKNEIFEKITKDVYHKIYNEK